MKKFLLCIVLAGLMMPVMAQEKSFKEKSVVYAREDVADLGIPTQTMLPTTSRGALVETDGWTVAGISKSYDRQSQGSPYPMAKVHDDGFIGCTWTNEDCEPFEGSTTPLRGVGYSYSTDGGETWSWDDPDNPEYQLNRVGGIPLYWPSYAQWGPNGEVILARSANTYEYNGMQILNGLVLLTRENKGQGEWNINVVPYPEGYVPDVNTSSMAWSRMTTGGPNHEYIHIISPMRIPLVEPFEHPYYYYRTQDGGVTWDHEAELIPGLDGYTDRIDMTARGNTVACSFMAWGYDGYLMKSTDNGDNWDITKFFDIILDFYQTPDDYDGIIYIPSMGGGIAIDKDGMVHLAFGVIRSTNSEQEGYMGLWSNVGTTFLTYWNEDMGPIDGDRDYNADIIDDLIWAGNCMDENLSDDAAGLWYVVSTTPEWPIIGYPIPLTDEHIVSLDDGIIHDWATGAYGRAGCFSFAQMTFDADDVLHLVYLGMLDGGSKGTGNWLRHPFYTTTPDKGKTWTETEYLVNYVTFIDQEFVYPNMAGIHPDNNLFMMAQTDPLPGTKEPYSGQAAEHGAQTNSYAFFYIPDVPQIPPPGGIDPVDYTPLSMQLFPNPASGQATVKFAGKGNITVYNMLGQTVYHVENVENEKNIPLNMASGVYFVTVRSGNAMAKQKLVVR